MTFFSKFQNEFMKSSFLLKYEQNIEFLPCTLPHYRAEIFTIFGSYFGRNDDFIKSFWNLLTFSFQTKKKNFHVSCTWYKSSILMLVLITKDRLVIGLHSLFCPSENKGIWLFQISAYILHFSLLIYIWCFL